MVVGGGAGKVGVVGDEGAQPRPGAERRSDVECVHGAARGRCEGYRGVEEAIGDGHGVEAGQDVVGVLGGLGREGRRRSEELGA